jgi:glycosyltransferase involved in cell wall biosynthesis
MKVAIYSHSIPPAVDGVSRRFTSIIHELSNAGHEVIIFTLEKEPTLEKILYPGEKLPRFKYVHLESTFHDFYPSKRVAAPTLGNLWKIGHSLLNYCPDIVHCTADAVTLQFGLVGKALGIPVVTSIHTDVQLALAAVGAPSVGLYVANLKEKMESYLLDGCATTSESFKAKLLTQGVKCDYVVKTSVQVDSFSPDKRCALTRKRLTFNHPEAFLVVYVGRLAPEKGLDVLLEMVSQVDNCFLALIGDGPLGPQFAARHGSHNRLYCLPGFIDHDALPVIYASADVHVTCSLFETLGNTILEAHACGIPVIAPRAQGFVDTVTHGKDGYLFDIQKIDDGIQALKKLRDCVDLREKMGKNGRNKVIYRAPEKVVSDIVDWYSRRAKLRDREGVFGNAFGASQLLGAVLLVLIAWNVYAIPAAVMHQMQEVLLFGKKMLCNSAVMKIISRSYATLAGPMHSIEGPDGHSK